MRTRTFHTTLASFTASEISAVMRLFWLVNPKPLC